MVRAAQRWWSARARSAVLPACLEPSRRPGTPVAPMRPCFLGVNNTEPKFHSWLSPVENRAGESWLLRRRNGLFAVKSGLYRGARLTALPAVVSVTDRYVAPHC